MDNIIVYPKNAIRVTDMDTLIDIIRYGLEEYNEYNKLNSFDKCIKPFIISDNYIHIHYTELKRSCEYPRAYTNVLIVTYYLADIQKNPKQTVASKYVMECPYHISQEYKDKAIIYGISCDIAYTLFKKYYVNIIDTFGIKTHLPIIPTPIKTPAPTPSETSVLGSLIESITDELKKWCATN